MKHSLNFPDMVSFLYFIGDLTMAIAVGCIFWLILRRVEDLKDIKDIKEKEDGNSI